MAAGEGRPQASERHLIHQFAALVDAIKHLSRRHLWQNLFVAQFLLELQATDGAVVSGRKRLHRRRGWGDGPAPAPAACETRGSGAGPTAVFCRPAGTGPLSRQRSAVTDGRQMHQGRGMGPRTAPARASRWRECTTTASPPGSCCVRTDGTMTQNDIVFFVLVRRTRRPTRRGRCPTRIPALAPGCG